MTEKLLFIRITWTETNPASVASFSWHLEFPKPVSLPLKCVNHPPLPRAAIRIGEIMCSKEVSLPISINPFPGRVLALWHSALHLSLCRCGQTTGYCIAIRAPSFPEARSFFSQCMKLPLFLLFVNITQTSLG